MGSGCQNDVVLTSMRRNHVASTLIRGHFHVMCPLRMNKVIQKAYVHVPVHIKLAFCACQQVIENLKEIKAN